MFKFSAVGIPGHRVTPVPRVDRGRRIYFQWPRPGRSKSGQKGGYVKVASDLIWPADPMEQAARVQPVLERAVAISQARARGAPGDVLRRLAMSPAALPGPASAPAVRETPSPARDAPFLTVREVLALAIGPSPRHIPPTDRDKRAAFWRETTPSPRGIYQTWTLQARQTRGCADQIEDRLGADTPFLALTANDMSRLWTKGVADNAVKRVETFFRVSRWAEAEYLHYRRINPKSRTWKQDIAEATTPPDAPTPDEARFSAAEAGRVWKVLLDPGSPISPVIRLATLVAGEARLGQVLNLRTIHVKKRLGCWCIKPPRAGRKDTGWILVPLDHQAAFGAALAAAERRPDRRVFPITRRNALTAWQKVSRLAGVPEYGWYAMRRTMTDLCVEALTELRRDTADPLDVDLEVVLDLISGHKPPGMRGGIYLHSPIGKKPCPKQPSTAYAIMASARRVVDRARENAIRLADGPFE